MVRGLLNEYNVLLLFDCDFQSAADNFIEGLGFFIMEGSLYTQH